MALATLAYFQALKIRLFVERRLAFGVAAAATVVVLALVMVSTQGGATPLPAAGPPHAASASRNLVKINKAIAAAPTLAPPPEAAPFRLSSVHVEDRAAAERCLTDAIYYEAALEPSEGQRAVAQVILNRVRDRAFPDTVCGVVYQGARAPGCQFSFACDGSLMRQPIASLHKDAERIAREALDGAISPEAGAATFYHAANVYPRWAPFLDRVGQVGAHIFYRQPGAAGLPGALHKAYSGGELDMARVLRVNGGRPAVPFGVPGLQQITLTTGPPSASQPVVDPLVCYRRLPTAETRRLCHKGAAQAPAAPPGDMAALWRHARRDRAKFTD